MSIIWALSGLLVSAIDRVAKRHKKPGFALAFIILGLFTSISEISVAFNSSLAGVPQVSAGNLVGGSLVIFLLIIPLLSVLGNGIDMNGTFSIRGFIFLLLTVAVPSLLALNGTFSLAGGSLMIAMYITLLYVVKKRKPAIEIIEHAVQQVEDEIFQTRRMIFHQRQATAIDLAKISLAGAVIFIAGKFLVNESIYFADLLSVPASLIGLILLSVGTNVPELVIAIRCVIGKHTDIAFGDYMGSAAANTLLMGLLTVFNGTFSLERSEFISTFFILAAGLLLFFIFSRTKNNLSRREGTVMLLLYALFIASQLVNFARFVGA